MKREYTEEEIQKTMALVFGMIQQKPDLYPVFVEVCARAWSSFKDGYDSKVAGLSGILWKLVKPKKALEFLANRKTHGYLNLDMFPEIEEELKRIANKS